ncbi:MAG TPA: DUF3365 domain-containing protein [Armatimonadota bacterium]|nr:DUF3365 domain-containing protein [Armatimonadota bacterium]
MRGAAAAALLACLLVVTATAAPRSRTRPAPRKAAPVKPAPAKPAAVKGVTGIPAVSGETPTRPMTLEEARTTVTLLDDAYNLLLQEVHAWYPNRTGQPIVAATTVRKIQEQMVRKGWPRSHFLAVNTLLMNPDHQAREAFDKAAVRKIAAGEARYEQIEGDRVRIATEVPLTGGCTSCHWSSGTRDGKAAITWSIPLKK